MHTYEEFKELANQWQWETKYLSFHREDNASYNKIIAMGKEAIPFILYEWESNILYGPSHWFVALHQITGARPIPFSDVGWVEKMQAHWINWCTENGYKAYAPV